MPSVAARAVGRQLMLVTVEAGEGAEFDHPAPAAPRRARVVSLPRPLVYQPRK